MTLMNFEHKLRITLETLELSDSNITHSVNLLAWNKQWLERKDPRDNELVNLDYNML